MPEEIIFIGKRYQNPSEMPADIRQLYELVEQLYEDENQDGMPDLFQEGGLKGLGNAFKSVKEIARLTQNGQINNEGQLHLIKISDYGISVNGKFFRDESDLPPDLRLIFQQATHTAEDGSRRIYDESWRPRPRESYFVAHDDESFQKPPAQASPIEVESSNARLLIFLIILVVSIAILGIGLWIGQILL